MGPATRIDGECIESLLGRRLTPAGFAGMTVWQRIETGVW